jgi:hypothetical protein
MLDMVHPKPLILTLLVVTGSFLSGCQTPYAVDLGPQLDADGRHRSVALDSPLQHHLSKRQELDTSRAWYAARNDYSPTAEAGYRLPTVQSSVTITRDQQYHSSGRVRDYFNSTTYRAERREIVN